MVRLRFFIITVLLCLRAVNAGAQVDVNTWNRYNNQGLRDILVEFNIQNGWHIFAPYAQEFGSPLEIKLKSDSPIEVLETSFSRPQTFNMEGFVYDGYKDKAFYKTTLKTDGIWRNIEANISWQACAGDECLPQEINLVIVPQETTEFEQKMQEAENFFLLDKTDTDYSWIALIFMAFTAGIILNLMPCVLPVLGLKVIACLKAKAKSRYQEAFFYSLGVVVSMLAVALILRILRYYYPYLGWGFQMQSLWFIGVMLVVFVILTLLAFELINLNSKWLNFLNKLHFNDCRADAFASGLLAVLIASPCTAPFMGAVIGYALMAPTYIYFPVFLSLGIGYALPFAGLVLFPQAGKKVVPHSGKWTGILKKILGIPLVLTCLWLAWILITQLGINLQKKNLVWQDYAKAKVSQALAEKRPVFIDFTADWCITCLMNKKTSLQSLTMAELAKEKNILLLKADITKSEKSAWQGLKSFGRASVPLYVYYDGKSGDYLILPPILTPQILRDYIK